MDATVFNSAPPVVFAHFEGPNGKLEQPPVKNTFIDFSERPQVLGPITAPGKLVGRLSGPAVFAQSIPEGRSVAVPATGTVPGPAGTIQVGGYFLAAPPQHPPVMQVPAMLGASMPPMMSPHLPPAFDPMRTRDIPPPPQASPVASAIPGAAAPNAQMVMPMAGVFVQASLPMPPPPLGAHGMAAPQPMPQQLFKAAPLLLPMGRPLAQGSLIEVTPVVQAKSPPRFAPPSYVLPTMSPTHNGTGTSMPPPMHSPVCMTPANAAGQVRCFPAVPLEAGSRPTTEAPSANAPGHIDATGWPATPF